MEKYKGYREAQEWLLQDWLECDTVRYTQQLAELAEAHVDFIRYGTSNKDLPELGWYQVEKLVEILHAED